MDAMKVWPNLLDMDRYQCKGNLRELEITAYEKVICAFRAEGSLTEAKKKILSELRSHFRIDIDRHKAEIRKAVNSEFLTTIARQIAGPLTELEWEIEGRNPIPPLRRAPPRTAFKAIADKFAFSFMKKNGTLPPPIETARLDARSQENQGLELGEETESEDETEGFRFLRQDMIPQHINKDKGTYTTLPVSEKRLAKQKEKKLQEEKAAIQQQQQQVATSTVPYKLVGAEKRKRKKMPEKPAEPPPAVVKANVTQSMAPSISPNTVKKIVFMPQTATSGASSRNLSIPILKGGGNMSKETVNHSNCHFVTAADSSGALYTTSFPSATNPISSASSTEMPIGYIKSAATPGGYVTKVLPKVAATNPLPPSGPPAKPIRGKPNNIQFQPEGYVTRTYTEYTTTVVASPSQSHTMGSTINYVGPSNLQVKSTGISGSKKVMRPTINAGSSVTIVNAGGMLPEGQTTKVNRPLTKVVNKAVYPQEMVAPSTGTITVLARSAPSIQNSISATRVVTVNSVHGNTSAAPLKNNSIISATPTTKFQSVRVASPQVGTVMNNQKGSLIYVQKKIQPGQPVKEIPAKALGKTISVPAGNGPSYIQPVMNPRTTIGNGSAVGNISGMRLKGPKASTMTLAATKGHSITLMPNASNTNINNTMAVCGSAATEQKQIANPKPFLLANLGPSITVLTKDGEDSITCSEPSPVRTIISSEAVDKTPQISLSVSDSSAARSTTPSDTSAQSLKRRKTDEGPVETKLDERYDDLPHKNPTQNCGSTADFGVSESYDNSRVPNIDDVSASLSKSLPLKECPLSQPVDSSSSDADSNVGDIFLVQSAVESLREGDRNQARTLLFKAGIDLMETQDESNEAQPLTVLEGSENNDSNVVSDIGDLGVEHQHSLPTIDGMPSSTELFYSMTGDSSNGIMSASEMKTPQENSQDG